MSISLAGPAQAEPFPPQASAEPLAAADLALLDAIGPVDGAHVLVIGDATLGMLCGLIRRGCVAAAEMTLHDRPMAEPAELVLVPLLDRPECAERAVALARRVLQPGGRIVLRAASGELAQLAGAMLRQAGFSAVAVRSSAYGTVIGGERPSFSPLVRS